MDDVEALLESLYALYAKLAAMRAIHPGTGVALTR